MCPKTNTRVTNSLTLNTNKRFRAKSILNTEYTVLHIFAQLLKNLVLLNRQFWIKKKWWGHPHENQLNFSWVARIGQNFDDYPGFQTKKHTCINICNTMYLMNYVQELCYPKENREVLVYEVSLHCYLKALFWRIYATQEYEISK